MTQTTARQAMIDAAERIIAERGIAVMTLKDVQIAAGQSNNSAATYHFGSRIGLIEAILESRMSPVNEVRAKLLDELESQDTPTTIRQAVNILVRPFATMTVGKKGSVYARFLSQALFDPALEDILKRNIIASSFWRIEELLIELVNATSEVSSWRVANIVSLSVTALARWEKEERSAGMTEAIVSDLVETCVAMLEAPATVDIHAS